MTNRTSIRVPPFIAIPYARVLRSNQRYDDALEVLRLAFRLPNDRLARPDAPVLVNALVADILFRKGDMMRSFEVIKIVLAQIKSTRRLSPQDADYLKYWMKWLLAFVTKYSDSVAFSMAKDIELQYLDLDLKRVSKRLLLIFPAVESEAREFDRTFLIDAQGGDTSLN